VENTWNNQARFMFEREASRQFNQGDQLLLRMLTVGDITFSGAFGLSMPAPLLNAMRQEQAAGKLDSIDAISVAGPRQDDFFGSIIAALMRIRPPAPAPMPVLEEDEKIGRNEPCPCGSGQKYKKCCGR
jgi:preprotein translocase subunit SecA